MGAWPGTKMNHVPRMTSTVIKDGTRKIGRRRLCIVRPNEQIVRGKLNRWLWSTYSGSRRNAEFKFLFINVTMGGGCYACVICKKPTLITYIISFQRKKKSKLCNCSAEVLIYTL